MSPTLAAWVLERPWGLAALALPLLVLLVARRPDRPRAIFAATFSLFADSAERPAESARTRRRPPPRAWLWVAALTVGALGLAGPEPAATRGGRTWRVVVDRSPSMGLPLAGATRQAAALDGARRELAAAWRPGDRARWVAAGRPELVFESARDAPDAAWLAPELAEGGDPAWDAEDRAGALWVTDAAPHLASGAALPGRAWLVASGGSAVPGAVGVEGADRLDWDGERLLRVPGGAPPRWIDLGSAPGAPGALGAFVRVWAETRGLALAPPSPGAAPALRLEGPSAGGGLDPEGRSTAVVGDGWSAACTVAGPGPGVPDGEVLFVDAGGQPCVWGRSGRLRHAFLEFAEPEGSRGAFAHAWARALEQLLPVAPGVMPLAERRAAGAARTTSGLPPVSEGELQSPPPIAAGCAALAALLGVVAISPRRRRRRTGREA